MQSSRGDRTAGNRIEGRHRQVADAFANGALDGIATDLPPGTSDVTPDATPDLTVADIQGT